MFNLSGIQKKLTSHSILFSLLIVILVAAFLRVYELGTKSIWLDEASTIESIQQDILYIVKHSGDIHNQPPFYFALLHFWAQLFGYSEIAIRSLSAIFGIISVYLIYKVGSQLFNQKTGLIGSILSTISIYHIYFSQEARGYMLLMMLALLSYYLYLRILQSDKPKKLDFFFLILTCILMAYTHVYGLMIIASQACHLLIYYKKYWHLKLWFLGSYFIMGLAFSPWVLVLFDRASVLSEEGFWIDTPSVKTVVYTFEVYSGSWLREMVYLPWVFFVLSMLGILISTSFLGRYIHLGPLRRIGAWLRSAPMGSNEVTVILLLWVSITIIVPFIISQFTTPIYHTRYTIAASPAVLLLVARGITAVSTRQWVSLILVISIVLIAFPGLRFYYIQYEKQDWKSAASTVEEFFRTGDIIVVCPPRVLKPFTYYNDGGGDLFGFRHSDFPDYSMAGNYLDGMSAGKERIWVVVMRKGGTDILRYFLGKYGEDAIQSRYNFKGVQVFLFKLPYPSITPNTFTEGLIGYWPMDEGEGQHVSEKSEIHNYGILGDNEDPGGDISDPIWVQGKIGEALEFDGIDDYVNCRSDNSFSIIDGLTIEAWIYLNETPIDDGHQFDIFSGQQGSDSYRVYISSNNTLEVELQSIDTIRNLNYMYVPQSPLEEKTWYYVSVTWDGLLISNYVNGTGDSYVLCSGTITASNEDQRLSISSKENAFDGIIDELRVYNRSLTAEEIYCHYDPESCIFVPEDSIERTD